MGSVRLGVMPFWSLLAMLVVAVCGCAGPAPDPRPSPEPSLSSPVGTIARLELGDRIIITATVDRRLDTRAFVIRDADLPAAGLLVLDPAGTDVAAPLLVTVHGMIDRFSFATRVAGYGLHESALFGPFEGVKALIAERVVIHE
jgi:hypothetical protein